MVSNVSGVDAMVNASELERAQPGAPKLTHRSVPSHFSRGALVLLLAILALLLSRGITGGEPYYFNDETRHVMNGAFVRDLLVDRPFDDPLSYAYDYYAKYPATALPHWPPLFPTLEGLLFLVLGIHFWVAKLLVLGFALMGAYYWYRIAEGEGPIYRAWFSALMVFTLPFIQLYSSIVMLEIPLLGLSMGVIYYWRRFQQGGASGHLWLMAVFTVASFLTSQKAIFLAVLVILSFLIQGPYRMLARWDVWAALVGSVSLVIPWYYFTHRMLSVGMDRAVGLGIEELGRRWTRHFFFYPEMIPQQMGWVLFTLAMAGLGWAVLRAPRRYGFFIIWIIGCYVTFTVIWEKDIRHAMIWIPPLVYFALLAIETLCAGRRWALVVCSALAIAMAGGAVGFQRPLMEGVTDVAKFILSQPDSDIIYYQGSLNGSFIYSVRKLDPEKTRMVVRDKQVVATQIAYGKRSLLQTPEEVTEMFRRFRIRYFAIENRLPFRELAIVERSLASGSYELIDTFPIRSEDPEFTGRAILVYRLQGDLPDPAADADPVTIPMMVLREGEIRADLSRLAGKPWPR